MGPPHMGPPIMGTPLMGPSLMRASPDGASPYGASSHEASSYGASSYGALPLLGLLRSRVIRAVAAASGGVSACSPSRRPEFASAGSMFEPCKAPTHLRLPLLEVRPSHLSLPVCPATHWEQWHLMGEETISLGPQLRERDPRTLPPLPRPSQCFLPLVPGPEAVMDPCWQSHVHHSLCEFNGDSAGKNHFQNRRASQGGRAGPWLGEDVQRQVCVQTPPKPWGLCVQARREVGQQKKHPRGEGSVFARLLATRGFSCPSST